MAAEKRKPELLAIILCDQVIKDLHTQKVTIVGSFSRIFARKFPAMHNHCAIYVALTDGQGTYEGEFRFVFAETDETVFAAKGEFKLDDPLQVAELNFTIAALPLPRPGTYRIEFYADGERLGGRRFVAEPAQKEVGRAGD
mgnify:CR=1 FL=1